MQIRNLVALAFVAVLAATQAQANVLNVEELKTTLIQNNAAWQPKNSWVNELNNEQLQKVLGYKQKPMTDFSFMERPSQTAGTDAIDWRNHNGQSWVSPILNQGNCGSCVAFASVATLETQMNISRSASWLNPHYSAEALFACGGGGCDSGWFPDSAASYLQSNGIPDEACAPYTMGATGVDTSCSSICSDASSRSQHIAGYSTPSSQGELKSALKHGPVVTTMSVYMDFLAYGSGIYKHTTGDFAGGHAVSIVGFDDAHRYWIVRNSWGKDWGENGFVRISYDDISGIGNETWSYQIPDANGVATIRNLHDRDYLSGKVEFDAISTYPNTSNITLNLAGANGKTTKLSCNSESCPLQVDSTKLADGRYEANLDVTAKGQRAQTEKKFFYVANTRPAKLAITMQPTDGTDLSGPVQGRIEFNVDTTSSTVPFSSLTFVVKQKGKVVETRGSDIALSHMVVGWRTTVLPNGTYDIALVGTIDNGKNQYQAESNHFTVLVQN